MITKQYRIVRYPNNKLVIHEVYLDGGNNVLEIESTPLAVSGFSKDELRKEIDSIYESLNEAIIPAKDNDFEWIEDESEPEDTVDFINRFEF